MDEFGQFNEEGSQCDEKTQDTDNVQGTDASANANSNASPVQPTTLKVDSSTFSKRRRETAPPSPAPFSHYAPLAPANEQRESRFRTDESGPVTVERTESTGCCSGCVVM